MAKDQHSPARLRASMVKTVGFHGCLIWLFVVFPGFFMFLFGLSWVCKSKVQKGFAHFFFCLGLLKGPGLAYMSNVHVFFGCLKGNDHSKKRSEDPTSAVLPAKKQEHICKSKDFLRKAKKQQKGPNKNSPVFFLSEKTKRWTPTVRFGQVYRRAPLQPCGPRPSLPSQPLSEQSGGV